MLQKGLIYLLSAVAFFFEHQYVCISFYICFLCLTFFKKTMHISFITNLLKHAENSQPTIQTSFTEKKTGLFIAE